MEKFFSSGFEYELKMKTSKNSFIFCYNTNLTFSGVEIIYIKILIKCTSNISHLGCMHFNTQNI